MPDYTLTFEITPDGDELEIHATREGLLQLQKQIEYLLEKDKDHIHLMTPSWGGKELSEEVQGEKNQLINHVKVFIWDWDN